MPLLQLNLYCSPQDVFNLAGIDAAQLRIDDRNQASGQQVQALADTPAGSTSMNLSAPLQYPMLAGSNLVFASGPLVTPVEVTLAAPANVNATSVSVLALGADIPAGAFAIDNGVNVWAASLLTTACKWGTTTVKRYCQPRYGDNVLATANSPNQWATVIAARWLAIRLYRAAQTHIEKMYDEAMEELRDVKNGDLSIEDIGTRTAEWPFMSNVTIDLGYTVRKVRVETQISEGTPTQYPQAVDWNSYLLLEY